MLTTLIVRQFRVRPGVALNDLSIALSNYLNLCALGDIRHIWGETADDLLNDVEQTGRDNGD